MSEELIQSYKPAHQLVFYRSDSNMYVEYHDVVIVDGKPFLSEGKPVTRKTLKKMLELVATSSKNPMANMKKLMPTHVLYFDPRPGSVKLIWYNIACERHITGLQKSGTTIKMPACLYVLDDGTLSVYVLKTGSKRPDIKTQLYHAPLPNVYDSGNVCMGSVSTPKNFSEISDLVAGWEYAFWNSKFGNHLWDPSMDKILKDCIKKKQPFPTKMLKPSKKTLGHLIK